MVINNTYLLSTLQALINCRHLLRTLQVLTTYNVGSVGTYYVHYRYFLNTLQVLICDVRMLLCYQVKFKCQVKSKYRQICVDQHFVPFAVENMMFR